MSSFCKVGKFNSRIGTGSQSITGVGFQPKGLIVFGMVIDPSLSWERHRYTSYGFTDGTFQFCGACAETDNAIPGAGTAEVLGKFILTINIPSATLQIATLSSFDLDGFTLNWSTNFPNPDVGYFMYVAFGGTDVSCKAERFSGPTGATQSITGVGFKPTGLFTSYDVITGGFAGISNIGWSDGVDEGSTFNESINSNTTSFTWHNQMERAFFAGNRLAGTIKSKGKVNSFDSDGFTINWETQGAASFCWYLAIKGLSFKVGKVDPPTVTGLQTVSGLNDLYAAILMSCNSSLPVNLGPNVGNSLSISVLDSLFNGCLWTASPNAVSTSPQRTWRRAIESKFFNATTTITPTEPDTITEATPALTGSGFTLNWTKVDASSRTIYYILIGPLVFKPVIRAYTDFIDSGPDFRCLLSTGYDLEAYYEEQVLPATFLWTKVSGPGDVIFEDDEALNTHVNFSKNGVYQLRITATINDLYTWDNIILTVLNLESLPGLDPAL